MPIEDLVSVVISRTSKSPTRAGFGIPLLAVSSVPVGWGVPKIRTFAASSILAELVALGFAITSPAYKMASLMISQSPCPKTIKVAKRSLPPTKQIKLTVTNITTGYVYNFSVDGTPITYTVLGGATTTTVATALAALIDPLPNVAATSAIAVITITAAVGVIFDVTGWYANAMTIADTTPDPGIATDLAAWAAYDADWYGFTGDSFGKIEQAAIAVWIEANKKICALDAVDSEIADGADIDDAAIIAKGLSLARSGWIVSNVNLLHWSSVAWLGNRFPAAPGSDTWMFKTLVGVSPSTWASGERSALFAKNVNTYMTTAGIPMTERGTTAVGEYFDIVRFIDWQTAEIQTSVFALLANAPKVSFTDGGMDKIKGTVQGRLDAGVRAGGLSPDPAPTVTAPLVADISTGDKTARVVNGMTFEGRLAGAVHAVNLTGTISV